MCVFVFSILNPSGNICMSVRGRKLADRTPLIHQHTHTRAVSMYNSHVDTHTHSVSGICRHEFSTIYHICNMFVFFFSLRFFHNTHTHAHTHAHTLVRLVGLKRGSVLDVPGIERPCFPCFLGNRPATNTPSEHYPVYHVECVCA